MNGSPYEDNHIVVKALTRLFKNDGELIHWTEDGFVTFNSIDEILDYYGELLDEEKETMDGETD